MPVSSTHSRIPWLKLPNFESLTETRKLVTIQFGLRVRTQIGTDGRSIRQGTIHQCEQVLQATHKLPQKMSYANVLGHIQTKWTRNPRLTVLFRLGSETTVSTESHIHCRKTWKGNRERQEILKILGQWEQEDYKPRCKLTM